MTEEQERIIANLTERYHEMRGLGHHDGAIFAAMIQEGWSVACVEEVKKAVVE